MKNGWLRYLPYILSGLILLGIGAAYGFSDTFRENIQEGWHLVQNGDRGQLSAWFRNFGFWGPVMIFLFMFLQMITVVLPSWLLMVVAILGYGPVWGSLLSIGGIAFAAAVAFWIGHGLGRSTLDNMVGKKTEQKMERFLDNYGLGAIALFRLSPWLSNDAISFIAGMLDMSFWRFMAGTLIGIIPLTIAIALFSDSLQTLENGLIWIGGGGILLYGIYVWLDRRKK